MSDYYVGEIRMFAGNYAPENWHLCDGTQLPISGNEALFALIGTTYGGNGTTNFNLPDLRGRIPIGQGTGIYPNGTPLTPRTLGQSFGAEAVALTKDQLDRHNHTLTAGAAAAATDPTNQFPGIVSGATVYYKPPDSPTPTYGTLDQAAVMATGGGLPHNNIMPSLCITYIIAVSGGMYPSQQ